MIYDCGIGEPELFKWRTLIDSTTNYVGLDHAHLGENDDHVSLTDEVK
jgi:hypothetical protein